MLKFAIAAAAFFGGNLFAIASLNADPIAADEPIVENQRLPDDSSRGCPCSGKGKGKK